MSRLSSKDVRVLENLARVVVEGRGMCSKARGSKGPEAEQRELNLLYVPLIFVGTRSKLGDVPKWQRHNFVDLGPAHVTKTVSEYGYIQKLLVPCTSILPLLVLELNLTWPVAPL